MKLPPGVTHRQLHYWASSGLIPGLEKAPGKGHPRIADEIAWRTVFAMGKLRKLGFEAHPAADIAYDLAKRPVNDRITSVRLNEDVILFVILSEFFNDSAA